MKLYGFMQDRKWYEDVGHVFIGLVPMWGWIREHRQLPPETERYPVVWIWDEWKEWDTGTTTDARIEAPEEDDLGWTEYWAKARVHDIFRDNLGYSIGSTLRFFGAIAAGWFLCRWLG